MKMRRMKRSNKDEISENWRLNDDGGVTNLLQATNDEASKKRLPDDPPPPPPPPPQLLQADGTSDEASKKSLPDDPPPPPPMLQADGTSDEASKKRLPDDPPPPPQAEGPSNEVLKKRCPKDCGGVAKVKDYPCPPNAIFFDKQIYKSDLVGGLDVPKEYSETHYPYLDVGDYAPAHLHWEDETDFAPMRIRQYSGRVSLVAGDRTRVWNKFIKRNRIKKGWTLRFTRRNNQSFKVEQLLSKEELQALKEESKKEAEEHAKMLEQKADKLDEEAAAYEKQGIKEAEELCRLDLEYLKDLKERESKKKTVATSSATPWDNRALLGQKEKPKEELKLYILHWRFPSHKPMKDKRKAIGKVRAEAEIKRRKAEKLRMKATLLRNKGTIGVDVGASGSNSLAKRDENNENVLELTKEERERRRKGKEVVESDYDVDSLNIGGGGSAEDSPEVAATLLRNKATIGVDVGASGSNSLARRDENKEEVLELTKEEMERRRKGKMVVERDYDVDSLNIGGGGSAEDSPEVAATLLRNKGTIGVDVGASGSNSLARRDENSEELLELTKEERERRKGKEVVESDYDVDSLNIGGGGSAEDSPEVAATLLRNKDTIGVDVGASGSETVFAKKIKWKKHITSALQSWKNPSGFMKFEEVTDFVLKSLEESGFTESKEQLCATLKQTINSSSRFVFVGQYVSLTCKGKSLAPRKNKKKKQISKDSLNIGGGGSAEDSSEVPLPPNKKRKHPYENKDGADVSTKVKKSLKKGKHSAKEVSETVFAKKIKWKKHITSALQSWKNPNGFMKFEEVTDFVLKSLEESGFTESKEQLCATLKQTINSSSRFVFVGQYVSLTCKGKSLQTGSTFGSKF